MLLPDYPNPFSLKSLVSISTSLVDYVSVILVSKFLNIDSWRVLKSSGRAGETIIYISIHQVAFLA